jgi:hypothetical protein
MNFRIQVVIIADDSSEQVQVIADIPREAATLDTLGLTLAESKQVLQESIKHYLWHGNSTKALDRLQDLEDALACWGCDSAGDMPATGLPDSVSRMRKYVQELTTYLTNNASFIVNYGERYRNGERISTAFVESTINQVVSKRMVKYSGSSCQDIVLARYP